ncbi:MAG TPA: response regulator, partial [Armatimonadota bacterium]
VEILETSGYETIAVNDGHAALAQYREAMSANRPFDIVIADLTIPGGMGGKETISQLRALDPAVCAIVTSGYSNDPVMADYTTFGFQGMLVKPFKVDDLRVLVEHILTAERQDHRPVG